MLKNKSYEVRGTFVQSQASLLVITTHYLSPNYLPFLNFSTFIHKARLSIPTAGDVVSIEYENNLNCLEQILAHLSTQYINDRHKEFVYWIWIYLWILYVCHLCIYQCLGYTINVFKENSASLLSLVAKIKWKKHKCTFW